MNNYFKVSEFIIDPKARSVPLHVADKIVDYHLPILNPIREELGVPVYISKNSGYRDVQWELDRGRSGNSQHTFGDGQPLVEKMEWLGAVDLRCDDMGRLLDMLKMSKYTRVCYYPNHGFIHCDFKGDERQYFEADGNGKWHYKGKR